MSANRLVEVSPRRDSAPDSELLVWPAVSAFLGLVYGLLLGTAPTKPGTVFLESLLLVQTVSLTLAIALVAIIAQSSSAEVRLLLRLSTRGVRLLFAEFFGGIVLSVTGIAVVLYNVSAESLPQTSLLVLILLVSVSTSLLVVSLLVLARRTTPERIVQSLMEAARDISHSPESLERWVVEVEAHAGRLVDHSDLVAFRQLIRGVADLQARVDTAAIESEFSALQVRLLGRGQKESLFGQVVIRELYRASSALPRVSNAIRARLEDMLVRVTSVPEIDRDLVIEVLRLGSHVGPNKQFWAHGLTTLLSTARVEIWDDRFAQPFVEQIANQRISMAELNNLVSLVVRLESVTPERLQRFVAGIETEAASLAETRPDIHAKFVQQVCRLRPRVLRGLVETHTAENLRQNRSALLRDAWEDSAVIGRHFPFVAKSVERELELLEGDDQAIYSLLILGGVEPQQSANEDRDRVHRKLRASLDDGDSGILIDVMAEQFRRADSSVAVASLGQSLAYHLRGTRLDGMSAALHVLWACKALGRNPESIGPRSLDYASKAEAVSQPIARMDQRVSAAFQKAVVGSLASVSSRLAEHNRLTTRGRLSMYEALGATIRLSIRLAADERQHEAVLDADRRRSILQSFDAISEWVQEINPKSRQQLSSVALPGIQVMLESLNASIDVLRVPTAIPDAVASVQELFEASGMERS